MTIIKKRKNKYVNYVIEYVQFIAHLLVIAALLVILKIILKGIKYIFYQQATFIL